jgi:lysophospholipase L1-like esterase
MKAGAAFLFALALVIRLSNAQPAASKTKKPAAAAVSPQARARAERGVNTQLTKSNNVENPGSLVPFYEQLYRATHGKSGAVHILHFGDSHTAADEWTGSLREHFQAGFGDGGPGFSLAGHPFRGYRRFDVSGGASVGWHTEGLARADGDGFYGLGGVSISTDSPGENVYIAAECSLLEVFYLQQPGGGDLAFYDNGERVGEIATSGEPGPGYFSYRPSSPGGHSFELRTLQHAPVRLFGWAADRAHGVTYEALGINGAEAAVMLKWNETMLASNLQRRDPALIVLAYGTNEAGSPNWDHDSYESMFSALLGRLRQYAPTASILVVGPPDRYYRVRRGPLKPLEKVGDIIAAQRDACRENGVAFWDTRARMGGKGSMRQWVTAGLAQRDYVHFLGEGYRLLGNTLFKDMMRNYEDFVRARESSVESGAGTGNQP